MAENFTPISRDQIPHYAALKNYEWVPGFLKLETLKPKIQKINREIAELKQADTSKATVLQRAKSAYESYSQRRLDWLSAFISKNRNAEDPFKYFFRDSISVNRFPPLFSWTRSRRPSTDCRRMALMMSNEPSQSKSWKPTKSNLKKTF